MTENKLCMQLLLYLNNLCPLALHVVATTPGPSAHACVDQCFHSIMRIHNNMYSTNIIYGIIIIYYYG